jgi:hypothetical protein
MSTPRQIVPRPAELEEAVKDRIVRRTAGRIRDLQVSLAAGRVEVRGRVASFHLKQLAIQAALDEIRSRSDAEEVEMTVQVEVGPLRSGAEVPSSN